MKRICLTKRFSFFAMTIVLLFSFTACQEETSESLSSPIEISGQAGTITFDPGTRSAGTITMDNGQYRFSYDTPGKMTIIYPDGYVYTRTDMGGGYGVPVDYDADKIRAKGYIDGFSLAWGIEDAMGASTARSTGAAYLFPAFLLAALGVWNLLAPKSTWWLSHGWRYKNAEPSDLALGLYRVGGGLLIFIAIIFAIQAF